MGSLGLVDRSRLLYLVPWPFSAQAYLTVQDDLEPQLKFPRFSQQETGKGGRDGRPWQPSLEDGATQPLCFHPIGQISVT